MGNKIDIWLWVLVDKFETHFKPGHWPWLGALLAFGYIVLADRLYHSGARVTLAPTFLLLVLSVYLGGFWWGLLTVAMVVPSEWAFWPTEHLRNVIVALTQLGGLVLISILQRQAMRYNSVDRNLRDLGIIEREITDVLKDWDATERKVLRKYFEAILLLVRDLLTRAKGWQELSDKIDKVRVIMDRQD